MRRSERLRKLAQARQKRPGAIKVWFRSMEDTPAPEVAPEGNPGPQDPAEEQVVIIPDNAAQAIEGDPPTTAWRDALKAEPSPFQSFDVARNRALAQARKGQRPKAR